MCSVFLIRVASKKYIYRIVKFKSQTGNYMFNIENLDSPLVFSVQLRSQEDLP